VKGLEPLIAAVILIAVTLVIGIAVVVWVSGLFAATVGGVEGLVILPNASLTNIGGSSWRLNLSIRNIGSYPSTVVAVYVASYTCAISPTTVGPGVMTTISSTCAGANIIPGVRYTVKVVTAAGNTFFSEVIAG